MSETRFTPGPWRAGPYDVVYGTDDRIVAKVAANRAQSIVLANMHLIAAAPELLDALLHMKACAACAESDWSDCEGGRAALAAIAKAEGAP